MKKALLAMVAAFVCSFARAGYLSWQLSSPLSDVGYALDAAPSTVGAVAEPGPTRPSDAMLSSFYIELVNWEGAIRQTEGDSSGETYATLQKVEPDELYLALTPTYASNVWHGSGYAAAPEPSCGLLIALGLGLVALGRHHREGRP